MGMKLTKETLNILKNFSTLNNGIVLRKGDVISTKTITNVVYGEAKLNQTIDEEIGIYDLNSFLNVVNLVGEDADICLDERRGNLVVSNQRVKINYPAASAGSIISPKGRVGSFEADVEYSVSMDDLKSLMKMSRQLNVNRLEFMPLDGRLFIRGWEEDDKQHPNEMFRLDMGEYTGSADFHFFISIDNMKLIDGDYIIQFNRKKIATLTTDNVLYMIACGLDSNYTE